MVLYRKYRPQKLSELAGQEHIKKILGQALHSGNFNHAYLFSGPRGTGKTTTARIVAKAINCLKPQTIADFQFLEPCGICDACVSVANGSSLDLIEIDAASNRGIDEIRDLREKIKLAPSNLKYKVYIIDEAHMLTTEAFNALLKTLEEPPSHAVFILCTTEIQKLPVTIISRCQSFEFQRPTISEITFLLEEITAKEKRQIDKEVFLEIAKLARGAFRDAEVLLEKVLSAFEKEQKITLETVESLLELQSADSDKILGHIIDGADGEAIIWLEQETAKGINLAILNDSILENLRQLLLISSQAGEVLVKPYLTKEDYETRQNWAKIFTTQEKLLKLIEIFSRSAREIKRASIVQLPLELAIIEAAEMLKGKAQRIKGKDEDNKGLELSDKQEVEGKSENNKKALETEEEKKAESGNENITLKMEELKEKWIEILRVIKPHNHSVEALLKSCQPQKLVNSVFIIEAFYPFHRDRLREAKIVSLIEKVAAEVFGQMIKVNCVLGEKPMTKKDIANVTKPSDSLLVKAAQETFANLGVDK